MQQEESAHAVWDCKYHLVWITKYRYKILRGDVAERARDLLATDLRRPGGGVSCAGRSRRTTCTWLVVAPPQLAPAKLVQFLKGRSSRMLQEEFPPLRKQIRGQSYVGRAGISVRRWARWTSAP